MKKFLLTFAAIAAALPMFAVVNTTHKPVLSTKYPHGPMAPVIEKAAPTRASGALEFSYARGVYTAYSFGDMISPGSRFYNVFEMSAEDIKAYADNTVTQFTVISPTDMYGKRNSIANGTFFITTDLEKGEEYKQDFRMSSNAFELNTFELETPYTITREEEHLYFGYSFKIPRLNDMYYIPVDGVPNSYPGSLICGFSEDGSFPTEFDDTGAAEVGALSMAITIQGDNLPENMALLEDVEFPPYIPISGDGNEMYFWVQNKAANPMSSVEVAVSVTGMPEIVETLEFAPISYGEDAMLVIEGIKASAPSFVNIKMQIRKVNGVDYLSNEYEVVVPAYEEGFPKKIVAEDSTGTWCGWCPGGIEALEYFKDTYPELAIAIGAHYNDEMQIDSYLEYMNYFVDGFPNIMYNRRVSQTPTDPYNDVCDYVDEVVDYFDFPAYAKVSLTGETNEAGTKANVKATAEFSLDTDIPHYLSFVVVEDGVGPYLQSNYFPSEKVEMNGWDKKKDKVVTIFNDVARYYDCFPGINGSLPETVKTGDTYEYSIEIPLYNVNAIEYRVIALLTNGSSFEIVNAEEITLTREIGDDAVDFTTESAAPVEYFNLNGQKVESPSNGIFIRRQGSKTAKVVIR